MIVYVVIKALVDLPDTVEFIGAFSTKEKADQACAGAGTFTVARMEIDRRYSGDLMDVWIRTLLDHRQI